MTAPLRALVRIDGPRRLQRASGKHLIELLGSEPGSVAARITREESPLEISLAAGAGMPYPQLVAASTRFPECVFSIEWNDGAASGSASIRNGRLESAAHDGGAAAAPGEAIMVAADGCLRLGVAVAGLSADGLRFGYAATRAAETWFCVGGAAATPRLRTASGEVAAWDEVWEHDGAGSWVCAQQRPAAAIAAPELALLETAARLFRARWLWFDQGPAEDTAIERMRARDAGRPVNPINVQSRAIAGLRSAATQSALEPASVWLPPLLMATWAAADQ